MNLDKQTPSKLKQSSVLINSENSTRKPTEIYHVVKCRSCGCPNEIAESLLTRTNAHFPTRKVPDGLENFLVEFTVNVLKSHPTDYNRFALGYFSNKVGTESGVAQAKINISEAPSLFVKDETSFSSMNNEKESWTKLDAANTKQGKSIFAIELKLRILFNYFNKII